MFDKEIPSILTIKTEIDMFTFISTFKVYNNRFYYKKITMHGRDVHGYLSEAEGNFKIEHKAMVIDHNEYVEHSFNRILNDN